MYLRRRIETMLEHIRTGKLNVRAGLVGLEAELDEIEFDEDGSVVLASCGPSVRAMARTYGSIGSILDEEERSDEALVDGLGKSPDLAGLQRELFEHYEEIFVNYTGQSRTRFAATEDDFSHSVRSLGGRMRSWDRRRMEQWSSRLNGSVGRLMTFYSSNSQAMFQAAKNLPGQKMVLGGTSRFVGPLAGATRRMALYADSILVPDPVMPWLSTDRSAERFNNVLMLQQLHSLLAFRDLALVDGSPVVVFPSFEKLLEDSDQQTQDGLELTMLELFNAHVEGEWFEDAEELIDFMHSKPRLFLEAVRRGRLFVPPDSNGTAPLDVAIATYRAYAKEWWSEEKNRELDGMRDGEIVLQHIMERVAPQYHLEENSRELRALPLLAMPQHWHYFSLLQNARAGSDSTDGADRANTIRVMRALSDESHAWMSEVPLDALALLRREGANRVFRERLDTLLKELEHADDGDYDAVVASVSGGLNQLLAEHDRDVRRTEEEWRAKYSTFAPAAAAGVVGSWIAAAAHFMPWFPNAIMMLGAGASGMALATKYAQMKVSERRERRNKSRTLLGYLSVAKAKAANQG